MERGKPTLMVIQGDRSGEITNGRIAVSFIHARGRVDVPIREVRAIEACETVTFVMQGTGEQRTYPHPHVAIEFSPAIAAQIYRLTLGIVGEALDIVIGGQCIMQPIVREPLCSSSAGFSISAGDLPQALELLHKLRAEWRRDGPVLTSPAAAPSA